MKINGAKWCVFIQKKALMDRTGGNKIFKIMYVSEKKIKIFSLAADGKNTDTFSVDLDEDYYKTYFKTLLQLTYEAENDTNKAKELRSSLISTILKDNLENLGTELWDVSKITNNVSPSVILDDKNEYFGIYVYVGTGTYDSQGRIIYNADRKEKTEQNKTIKLPIKKISPVNKPLANVKLKIESGEDCNAIDNLKLIDSEYWGLESDKEGYFGEIEITPKKFNKKSVNIVMEEIIAGDNVKKLSGKITLKIEYNEEGNITKITPSQDKYRRYFEFKLGEIGKEILYITNEMVEPNKLIIQKIDSEGNPIANIPFKVELTGVSECTVGGTKIRGKKGKIKFETKTNDKGQIIIDKIELCLLGDIDGNGEVTAEDARKILQASEGLLEEEDISSRMDLDGDGLIFSKAKERNIKLVYEDGKTYSEDDVLTMSAFDLKKNNVVYYLLVGYDLKDLGFTGYNYSNLEVITSEQIIDEGGKKYIEFSNVPEKKKNVINGRQYAVYDEVDDKLKIQYNQEGALMSYIDEIEAFKGIYIKQLKADNDDNILSNQTCSFEAFNDSLCCLRIAARLNDNLNNFEVKVEEADSAAYEVGGPEKYSFYTYNGYMKMLETKDDMKQMSGLIRKKFVLKNDISEELGDIAKDIIIEIENTPKPFDLKILKKDQFGKKLGAGYKFRITIDNLIEGKNEDNKAYVSKNTFEATTNLNGEIEIKGIYTKSLVSNVKIEEIEKPDGTIYGMISPTEFKIDRKNGSEETKNNIIMKADEDHVTVELEVEEPTELNLNILKKGENGTNLAGAVFDVTIYGDAKYENETYITDENGTIQLSNVDLTDWKNPMNPLLIELEEIAAPEGYDLPKERVSSVELKLNVGANGEYEYKIVNNDNCKANLDKTTLNIEIINYSLIDELTILKQDPQTGKKLQNAEFKLSFSNVIKINEENISETKTYTTDENGEIKLKNLVINDPTKDIIIRVEEIKAPDGYKKLNGAITIELKRNGDNYEVKASKDSGITDEEFDPDEDVEMEGHKLKLNIKDELDIPPIEIGIEKVDPKDKGIDGIEFTRECTLTDIATEAKTTTGGGEISFSKIEPKTKAPFKITIKETKGKSGYKLLDGDIVLSFKYNESEKSWDIKEENMPEGVKLKNSGKNAENTFNLELTATNKFKLENLTIFKKDSQTNDALKGARFEITFDNIEEYVVAGEKKTAKVYKLNTNDKGELIFTDLVIKDGTREATIEIEEVEAPVGYKIMEGPVILTIKRNEEGYEISKTENTSSNMMKEKEYTPGNITVTNHKIELDFKDIPIINLGGIVWKDGQKGIKGVQEANGKYEENEAALAGIDVELHKKDGTLVTTDVYGNSLMNTTTEGETIKYITCKNKKDETKFASIEVSKGGYVFPNIEKGEYYVVFKYNGIKYQTYKEYDKVISSGNMYKNNAESKAGEVTNVRTEFNQKFKTIEGVSGNTEDTSYGKATAGNINLQYKYKEAGEGQIASILQATENGLNPANGNAADFQMQAETANYLQSSDLTGQGWKSVWDADGKINTNSYAQDINCGLLERSFTVDLRSQVNNVEYQINGKNWQDVINSEVGTVEMKRSDYYYRYDNLVSDAQLNDDKDNAVVRKDILGDNTELDVFVTYKLTIGNGSSYVVEKIQTKYDYNADKQELVSITTTSGDNYDKYTAENGTITITTENLTNENSGQELYLKFKLKKTGRDLPAEIATENGLTCENTAEIISYTTEDGGLIDNNSAPGNYLNSRKKANTLREDDEIYTSQTFKLSKEAREITGNVAEADGSGNLLNDKNINGITVQLIEVIDNKEYIWQETTTGSNVVKAIDKDGIVYTFNNKLSANEVGKYQFLGDTITNSQGSIAVGFIPGNYVVRFIYGDGITRNVNPLQYDSSDTTKVANAIKYNGQDYKSAVDKKYTEEWYKQENYNGKSTARDNEARRLEVMAYSNDVEAGLGTAFEVFVNNTSYANLTDIQKQNLNKYFASLKDVYNNVASAGSYTLEGRIKNIFKADDMIEEELTEDIYNKIKTYVMYKTWMCAETSKVDFNGNFKKFENVNFGLVERPKTKLVLEKHITGLKITPNGGTQPVVDAKVVNDEIQGITTGLKRMDSKRNERGFWSVETDIEELAQGAKLDVEYTYTIKNEGDDDYLSSALVNEYQNNKEGYANYLNNIVKPGEGNGNLKNTLKGNTHKYGKYLGQYYYNGEVDKSTDELVPSTVIRLEDNAKEDLTLEEKKDFEQKGTETKKVYSDVAELKDENVLVLSSTERTKDLTKDEEDTKTAKLTTVLYSTEKGLAYPTYIAEITEYANAAGRRDVEAVPGNLSYVHSYDTEITLDEEIPETGKTYNEHDEFWGEALMVTKPTGENKQQPTQIVIIAISSIAVIGVGIILVKKYALK